MLQELSAKGEVQVHFFNAMTYEDTKAFLGDLDRDLCLKAKRKSSSTRILQHLVFSVQESIRKLNCYKYTATRSIA